MLVSMPLCKGRKQLRYTRLDLPALPNPVSSIPAKTYGAGGGFSEGGERKADRWPFCSINGWPIFEVSVALEGW